MAFNSQCYANKYTKNGQVNISLEKACSLNTTYITQSSEHTVTRLVLTLVRSSRAVKGQWRSDLFYLSILPYPEDEEKM